MVPFNYENCVVPALKTLPIGACSSDSSVIIALAQCAVAEGVKCLIM